MNLDTINAAVAEAERFLERAATVKRLTAQSEYSPFIGGGKETGALRRASLELTRALSAMRRAS